jgi:hypothetical protein
MLVLASSCKKEVQKDASDPKKKYSLISGTMAVDQSWIDLRDKAKNEFDFYFRDYYHGRDFLKEVDWSRAILNEYNGQKVMVFLFRTDPVIKTDARLMVIQDGDGNNHYSVRIKSKEDNNYVSIYNANDKILTIGTVRNETFEPITQTPLKGTGIPGGSVCASCHNNNGDGNGGDDWGDPDGPGGINENNWLDDVVITDRPPTDWSWVGDTGWDGYIVAIPDGNPNIDNDPCATFQNLMNNPAFREKLQQLLSNTTLNQETAFTYDGSSFSPFAYGAPGVDHVDIPIPANAEAWGHSHFDDLAPTFTPGDLQSFFDFYLAASAPMNFVAIVATPYGMYMIKVVDAGKFNTFGNTYLNDATGMNILAWYYGQYGITMGTNTGDNLPGLLNTLQSGLMITKIPDPESPDLNCN